MDQVFADLNRKYKKEMTERKRLHNVIQELKGNIRVYLRCRPPSTRELENAGKYFIIFLIIIYLFYYYCVFYLHLFLIK